MPRPEAAPNSARSGGQHQPRISLVREIFRLDRGGPDGYTHVVCQWSRGCLPTFLRVHAGGAGAGRPGCNPRGGPARPRSEEKTDPRAGDIAKRTQFGAGRCSAEGYRQARPEERHRVGDILQAGWRAHWPPRQPRGGGRRKRAWAGDRTPEVAAGHVAATGHFAGGPNPSAPERPFPRRCGSVLCRRPEAPDRRCPG